MLNLWIVGVVWLAGVLPGGGPAEDAFFTIRGLAFSAVAASMIAYLAAQLVDVHVFHLLKRLTRGRMLWLRNNLSTLVSQFVDTFAVITITHFSAKAIPIDADASLWPQLWVFILTGYAFKAAVALDRHAGHLCRLLVAEAVSQSRSGKDAGPAEPRVRCGDG